MQKQILNEIKELKTILARLIGASDLPQQDQFSVETLDKAAKSFLKLQIERGEWVEDEKIGSYIKNAPWRAGAFIRNEFRFKNFFKRGHTYYYNKNDLVRLSKELKERNIDLGRYIDLKEDQKKFQKYLASIPPIKKGKNRPYQLPEDLKDITTSAIPAPSAEIIREDLKNLKEEFFQYKLSEYIDIYKDNHAMMKFIYHFEKYIDPQLKKRCSKWCDNFNYANHALEQITRKKEEFIPVSEEEMIQL